MDYLHKDTLISAQGTGKGKGRWIDQTITAGMVNLIAFGIGITAIRTAGGSDKGYLA